MYVSETRQCLAPLAHMGSSRAASDQVSEQLQERRSPPFRASDVCGHLEHQAHSSRWDPAACDTPFSKMHSHMIFSLRMSWSAHS